MTNAIVAEALTKRFGPVTAVAGIDLQVKEGTVFGLLGPNGADKTTTVHILATLVTRMKATPPSPATTRQPSPTRFASSSAWPPVRQRRRDAHRNREPRPPRPPHRCLATDGETARHRP